MTYAAFFQGLNVGGKNKTGMAELRRLFADCGFTQVQTYIQSGNVVFDAVQEPAELPALIARAFRERFGFDSAAAVRTGAEVAALVAALPFSPEEIARAEAADPDVRHVYYFLSNRPVDPAALQAAQAACGDGDRVAAGDRAVYLLCAESIRLSQPAKALYKLDASFTVRNHNTLRAVESLLDARA